MESVSDALVATLNIVYEDNHLIAINKKSGQLVQADNTNDLSLPDIIKKYLKDKYNKPGDVFCGVIHRLDRPVTGLVLFAKTSKALERMSAQFKEREIQKTYWAIVKTKPIVEAARLENFLIKDTAKNKSRITYKKEGANLAVLDYKYLVSSDKYHLLEVKPITGRHHQIRVQLSSKGYPIKGDLKYGFDRSNEDGSICLHARMLEFTHPVKKDAVILLADPPNDPLWNYFLKKVTQPVK